MKDGIDDGSNEGVSLTPSRREPRSSQNERVDASEHCILDKKKATSERSDLHLKVVVIFDVIVFSSLLFLCFLSTIVILDLMEIVASL